MFFDTLCVLVQGKCVLVNWKVCTGDSVLGIGNKVCPHFQVIGVLGVEIKCVLVKNPYFNACSLELIEVSTKFLSAVTLEQYEGHAYWNSQSNK